MPGWRARQLCGDLLFVGGQFRRYQQFGDDVVSVFHDFTPRVERVSIDEAFLDVAGAVHLFGAPTEIAAAVRRRVRDEIGLPLSVGVARTKHLAKVASQVAKPDGLVAVDPADERALPRAPSHQADMGCRAHDGTTPPRGRDPYHRPARRHREPDPGEAARPGQTGAKLAALSANIDARTVQTPARSKSMGAQAALGRRQATPELIRETLGYLADRVAGRLRKAQSGRTDGDRKGPFRPSAFSDPVDHAARCHLDDPDSDGGGRAASPVSHRRQPGGTGDHPFGRVGLQSASGTFIAARAAPR